MPPTRIVKSDSNCGIAACGNVVLLDLRGTLQRDHVLAMSATYTEVLTDYEKFVALVVARRGVPMATKEARDEGAHVARKFGSAMAHVAIVFEDSGIVAQLLRTVVRGFSIISRHTPLVVYDDVDSAVRGIESVLRANSENTLAPALTQALYELRGVSAQV